MISQTHVILYIYSIYTEYIYICIQSAAEAQILPKLKECVVPKSYNILHCSFVRHLNSMCISHFMQQTRPRA